MTSADRAEQEGEVVDLTARLLAGVLADSNGADLIRQVLPTACHQAAANTDRHR